MSKKKSKLQQAQDEAQASINETNKKLKNLENIQTIYALN